MPAYNNPDFREPPPGLAAVFAAAGKQSFFSLPEWYDLLARCVTSTGAQIRVYTGETPGSMVAIPLQRLKENGRERLASLANFYSVEHEIISGPDTNLDNGLTAIITELNAERPRWHRLDFVELDPGHASYHALVRTLRHAGAMVECTAGAGTWYERTDGLDFATYRAARPGQLLNTWERKRRSIRAAGHLTAAFVSGASDIERAIADYQTIYAASWKPAEPFSEFIPGLIRLAAALGALRLGIYYIDDRPVAAQLWIVWNGRATIYKLAHNKNFDQFSPGTLLTMYMVERVLEEDRPFEINFGRGDDPYKRLWLPRHRQRWGITAANWHTMRGFRLGLTREMAKIYHLVRGTPIRPPFKTANVFPTSVRTGSTT